MVLIKLLHEKVSELAPIHGVAIPDESDKATWRIDFKESATKKQRNDAQAILDGLDWAEEKSKQENIIKRLDEYKLKAARAQAEAANDTEVVNEIDKTLSRRRNNYDP